MSSACYLKASTLLHNHNFRLLLLVTRLLCLRPRRCTFVSPLTLSLHSFHSERSCQLNRFPRRQRPSMCPFLSNIDSIRNCPTGICVISCSDSGWVTSDGGENRFLFKDSCSLHKIFNLLQILPRKNKICIFDACLCFQTNSFSLKVS